MGLSQLLSYISTNHKELSDIEIADALWLVMAQAQTNQAQSQGVSLTESETSLSSSQLSNSPPSVEENNISQFPDPTSYTGLSRSRSAQKTKRVPIHTPSQQEAKTVNHHLAGSSIQLPTVSGLPRKTDIARAFKQIRQFISSQHHFQLDISATVERGAEERLFAPVIRAMKERRFSLHLVIDQGGSGLVWQESIKELYRLLAHLGVLRDIRRWYCDSDSPNDTLLLFQNAIKQQVFPAHKLQREENRHIILLVSDCAGQAWFDGRMLATLEHWSKHSSTAILQLMPPQLWKRTVLGQEVEVYARLKNSLQPSQLTASLVDEWEDELPQQGLIVPIITLEPDHIKNWLSVLTSKSSNGAPAYIFDLSQKRHNHSQEPQELDAQSRVKRFMSLSSPTSQRLALLAAAAPVTLPILNLLRVVFLKNGSQRHLAEVLLGGLLYRESTKKDDPSENVIYEFYEGVREYLLDLAPLDQTRNVIQHISHYLEERVQREREMQVTLGLPNNISLSSLPEGKPFAAIQALLLRRLGYEELADKLEKSQINSINSEINNSGENIEGEQGSEEEFNNFIGAQASLDQAHTNLLISLDLHTQMTRLELPFLAIDTQDIKIPLSKRCQLLLDLYATQHNIYLTPERYKDYISSVLQLSTITDSDAIILELLENYHSNQVKQAFRVGVYSYGAKNVSNSLDYSLDLEEYFSQSLPSGLPHVRMWESDVLPRLRRVLAQSNEQPLDTIALDAQVHNSVGIALGSLFPETSRYTLRIRQQEQWWSSRAPASNSQLVHVNDQGAPSTQAAIDPVVLASVLAQYFNLDDLREICFSQQINFEDIEGATLGSKARGLATYMRQRNKLVQLQNAVIESRPFLADQLQQTVAAKELIALEVGIARPISAVYSDVKRSLQRLGLPINRHIQLGLIGERVEGEQEAQQIAKTIVKTIKRLRDQEGYRQELHLFTALPMALAVMLGCQLNACGPIQLYEYSKNGDQAYYPAWRYNG
jgi:hypothetical protein